MRAAKWTAGILAAIAILGFLVLPPAVRHFGERALADALGRQVTIERVRINPFALSLTVSNVRVAEADGQGDAFSFVTLYANLQAESLIRGGPVLRELRVEAPHARFARLESGRNNWSDVIDRFAAKPPSEDDDEARFSVNNIRIIGGAVAFEDRMVGLKHELSQLDIGLPFLSNLPAKVDLFVEPVVSALVNGRPLRLDGRTRPFSEDRETVLDVVLDGFDFTPYLAYLPFDAAFKVPEGRLTTRLEVAFSQPVEVGTKLAVKGTVELAGFRLENTAGEAMLSVPSLVLNLADVQPLGGKWHFDRLEIAQPEVDVVRLANGKLNFQEILPTAMTRAEAKDGAQDGKKAAPESAAGGATRSGGEKAAGENASTANGAAGNADGKDGRQAPPVFALDHARIDRAQIRFEDRTTVTPFRTELRNVVIEARNLGTAPDAVADVAVDFTTDADEKSNHRGHLRLVPFELDGRVAAENLLASRYAPYYGAALPGGEIRNGRVDATVKYTVKTGEGEPAIDVLAEAVVLRDFELGLKGQSPAFAKLSRLAIENVAVAPAGRSITVGRVESKGASFSLVRGRDGRLDALGLLDAPSGSNRSVEPASGQNSEAQAGKPWSFVVEKLALDDWAVRLEDRTLAKPIVMQANAIKLTADGLSSAKGATTELDLDAQVNRRGRATISGTLTPSPLKGSFRIDLRSVGLLPLQPYLVNELNIEITGGNLTSRGTLAFDMASDGTLKGSFKGNLGVSDFSSIDTNHSTDFVRWQALNIADIDLRLSPFALSIAEIGLTDFYTRLILDETGQLNLREIRPTPQHTEAAEANEAKPEAETKGRTTTAEVPPPPESPPPIAVGKIVVKQGNIAFRDRFVRPNYDANLTGMEGELVGLSSDPATLARLDLRGKVAKTAPVTVAGEFNPFRQDRYLDIAASVKDFELTAVSMYSSKYVGYGIEKGKLSADLNYKIEDRKLSATNRVFLDQLTFGEKVDSPDALNLPVQLAVSLLKNREGEIDLRLPISGSLDDPQFSIAGLVFKAIVNLVGKALTAPFALLGSMFGGGEELSYLEFAPGRASFPPTAEEKLATLAKALTDRPALRLEITGQADPASDTEGLKKVRLERAIKAAKLKASGDEGEGPPLDEVVIGPEEYAKWLERVYRDADFERPRNMIGLLKDLPPAEMEALILANTFVDDEGLRRLAQRRAQAAKTALLEKGQIPAERIFLLAPKVEAGEGEGGAGRRAVFSLR
ncbi:DUF748 domain-containing protein [Aromatoleum sp.]|uniref:DUF748 domain-containing protein n=1 Tax=Aromatoleum sp. TaxID=2307007 RepID=UPI002FC92E06